MKLFESDNLSSEYSVHIDTYLHNEWNNILLFFEDSNINQTWDYNNFRSKRNSTIVLKKNNIIILAAIIRIELLPLINKGIAYLGNGPLWRLKNGTFNKSDYQKFLSELTNEYVIKRNLYLQISTNTFNNEESFEDILNAFQNENFKFKFSNQFTFILNINKTIEELRTSLHPKWRNALIKAEKSNLKVRISNEFSDFIIFSNIYIEMLNRKKYKNSVDLSPYEYIQKSLPLNLKPTIVICEKEDVPLSGAVFSTCGDTAIYLLGATSNEGLQFNSSYLIQWRFIEWLKINQYSNYDLGGVDPKSVPTTYQFKSRICGKEPIQYMRLGFLINYKNVISKLIVDLGTNFKKYISN